MDKQFFVGPSKLNIIKQPKLSPTPIPLKPPTKRRPRRNPVHEAQQTFQVGVDQHREHFRHFLRSSLALLDGDIVETVIKEFDNHCSCENRAVESASHFLATATMNRVLPELRQLQLVIDAAETSCTDECVHVINQQRLVTMSQSRVDDLIAIEMPPEKGGVHPGTQVDLMLLGGVNDLLAWGEQLRDTLITAYRRAEQGPQSDLNGIQTNNGTQHGSNSSGKKSSRPSTAPSKRRPPASGGFGGGGTQDYTGSQNRNIYGTTTKRRPQSASKKRTTTNNNNTSNHNNSNHSNSNSNHSNMVASLYRRDEDKPEERRLLRQTLGSYYSADNSSSSNLNALLTSSGGFGGIRNPMPNVKRNKSKKNPNNYTKQRAKSRAKNQVDLAHYNAFHARPMLRRGGTASNSNLNFDGPRRRKVPKAMSRSGSTIDMQKRKLLRGLPENMMQLQMEMDELEYDNNNTINMEEQYSNKGMNTTPSKLRRKVAATSSVASSPMDSLKGLNAAKNRHRKKTKKKNKDLSGW